MDKRTILPTTTVQLIVNYLTTRPWREVNDLLAAISREATDHAPPVAMPPDEHETQPTVN